MEVAVVSFEVWLPAWTGSLKSPGSIAVIVATTEVRTGTKSSGDPEDDEVSSGLRYNRSALGHLSDAGRQFISTMGGGLNFERGEGAGLREVPHRGDGMCLYYSLLKTYGASLADGLRQGRSCTSTRSIGFCAIWVCISSGSSSVCVRRSMTS